MGRKKKYTKINFISVATRAIRIAKYPAANEPSAYVKIFHHMIDREWMRQRENYRDMRPHQLKLSLIKNTALCVLFYSGRGSYAEFAQDLYFFVLLKDTTDSVKDYTEELHYLVDYQIAELVFIAVIQGIISKMLPMIYSVIRTTNKQARGEKVKEIRSNILQKSSPIVRDLFKSKYSSYSIYSYYNFNPKYPLQLPEESINPIDKNQ